MYYLQTRSTLMHTIIRFLLDFCQSLQLALHLIQFIFLSKNTVALYSWNSISALADPCAAAMTDSTAAEQQSEPPPPSTPISVAAAYHLYPRREPFEHGLLPIPKLIFSDGTQTLSQLKSTLLSSDSNQRLNSDTLARLLQIPIEHSRLIIETIASVLHDESDPLLKAGVSKEIDEIGVNVFDMLVFLYIQSYKRLLPKGHKDSAAVADVWPSTSAFDGFLSALSPLQVINVANFFMYWSFLGFDWKCLMNCLLMGWLKLSWGDVNWVYLRLLFLRQSFSVSNVSWMKHLNNGYLHVSSVAK